MKNEEGMPQVGGALYYGHDYGSRRLYLRPRGLQVSLAAAFLRHSISILRPQVARRPLRWYVRGAVDLQATELEAGLWPAIYGGEP